MSPAVFDKMFVGNHFSENVLTIYNCIIYNIHADYNQSMCVLCVCVCGHNLVSASYSKPVTQPIP